MVDHCNQASQQTLVSGRRKKRVRGLLSIPQQSGTKCRIFDYVYYADFQKKYTTVIEWSHPKLDLKNFRIQPKGKLSQIKEIFVRNDQEVITLDDFYNRYELIYDNSRSIRIDLNRKILHLITPKNNLVVEGNDQYLILYFKGKVISVPEMHEEYIFSKSLFEKIIEYKELMD